jgi:predicted AlkP superfamily pyrophosphatase or phosphodiesterase
MEKQTGGVHGLPAHFPSMKASFILAGPGVKQGVVLEDSRMIDIAPTLARLLGLELPEADGRPLTQLLER